MEKEPKLHTADEIRAYIEKETAQQNAVWREKYDHILRAKNAIWLLLLVVVFLQFYLINVMVQVGQQESYSSNNAVRLQNIGCRPLSTQL